MLKVQDQIHLFAFSAMRSSEAVTICTGVRSSLPAIC